MEEPKHKLPLRSSRLESLGDGIFAVAMTILVIELKWPELEDTSWHAFASSFTYRFAKLALLLYKFYCVRYYVVWSSVDV